MDWYSYVPVVLWCVWVFVLGLMVGSFLNVLIARLPYEKSIVWPSSRCFNCFRSIRITDNLPIVGYLRLRGKCRYCRAPFSISYLWVELGTGIGFLALFVVEILLDRYRIPALRFNVFAHDFSSPPGRCWVYFAYHAFLLSTLIAAAVIDAEHRIIPPLIPYTGVLVGVVGGALLPWPWPNPTAVATVLPNNQPWMLHEYWGKIPLGLQPWPFWGPTFKFAPPGSIQLGLLNALIGALVGSLVVRLVKWLFEVGFGREAMGLGDADLLMMAGAFLGWQIAALSLFTGAIAALVLKILGLIFGPAPVAPAPGTELEEGTGELPFGPGLAIGVVVTWLAWPWLGPRVQFVCYDLITLGLSVLVLSVGMVASGLLLRRPDETAATPTAANKG